MSKGEAAGTNALNSSDYPEDITRIIDSKVSLITNSNIWYEGVLIKIKGTEMKLTLQDVKIMGTEGRNQEIGQPEKPAPPPEKNHFSQVEFSIDMIKQLKIVEEPSPTMEDPAIVGVTKGEPKSEEEKTPDTWS